MHISWGGHYTVRILKPGFSIIINPHSPDTGLSPPRANFDLILLSNPTDKTMSNLSFAKNDYIFVDQPGEYSFDDISIVGTGWRSKSTPAEQVIYQFVIDNMTLLYLGSLNRELTQAELQHIEQSNIDILFVPVGGSSSISTAKAIDVVTTIEPNIVIPINHSVPKLKLKVSPINEFAKEMGVKPSSSIDKLSITANKIDTDNITTVLLSP